MTAFDQAWDIAKAFGDGFRVQQFDPQLTGVGELPSRIFDQEDPALRAKLSQGVKSPFSLHHTFDSLRGSGTGVGGAYFHGGDFDPRYEEQSTIPFLSRDADELPDTFYSVKPRNPFVPFDAMGFFQLSRYLESLEDEPREMSDRYRNRKGGFLPESRGRYSLRTNPLDPDMSQPDLSNLYGDIDRDRPIEDQYFGGMSVPGHRITRPRSLDFADNLLDQLRDSPYINRIMGERGEKPPYMSGFRRNPITGRMENVRRSPSYEANQRAREKYDEPWWEDSNVLSQLLEDSDYYALPKMNILLDSMGYDSVVPFESADRGSTSGIQEIGRGSVIMPPVEDDWWRDWHPGGDDGYQKVTNEDLKNMREGVARQILNFGNNRTLSQHPEMGPGGSWREILEEFGVEDYVRHRFDQDKSDLMWGWRKKQR